MRNYFEFTRKSAAEIRDELGWFEQDAKNDHVWDSLSCVALMVLCDKIEALEAKVEKLEKEMLTKPLF